MDKKEIENQVIQQFKQDEHMMILVFAQWCINNDLLPEELYKQAYPNQIENKSLQEAMALTVSKEEAGPIADDTVLGVLSLFGNEELAFIVTKEIEQRTK
ncbi:hypothetical protein [Bacillus suaedae]|uniref:YxiS n=1 Tax=Halalkalibacter suaedae TaxID=2822140 RepID=A0A941AME5_9BACI|nr:hypothetical protein [Bacillus suaedae]MBP3950425.1 hypothetical protein [Bacillus suaedae]